MVALRRESDPGKALGNLASELESLEFGPDTGVLSADRDRLAGMIRSYLIPRVIGQSTPPTIVVAGPTGSGKSTLVNSLAGLDVSPTGALRPTTNVPVVLSSSLWSADFETIGGVKCRVVTDPSPILDTMVLVDSPDIDSTSTGHRAMAETLADNADLVVFVTSALRYADDLPWQVLRRAVSRGSPVVHVLNRVSSAGSGAIVDFKAMLSAADLDDDLVIVPEHHLSDTARRVPTLAIHSLQQRLTALLANRSEFAADVRDRVLRSTIAQVNELAGFIDEIEEDLDDLQARLTVGLAERVSNLSLTGVSDGLYPSPPDHATRRVIRRWKRTARREPAETRAFEQTVADRLAATIQSDLRNWLVAERAELKHVDVDTGLVATDLAGMTRSAISKWIEYVGRIVAETDLRGGWLAEAVLIDASLSGSAVGANYMFGDGGRALVDRARRELTSRLEALYGEVGSFVVGSVARRQGDLDVSALMSSLGVVISMYAPVDA